MQEISPQRRQGYITYTQLSSGAVKRVTHDGMFQRGQVYAYLVGAAGVQLDFQQGGGVDAQ